jgi:hypothetical protein
MTKIAGSGPLVRGMDPRIRIHPKMSWIRNSGINPRSRIGTKTLRFRFFTILIIIPFGSGPSRAEQGETNAGGATQDLHTRGEAQGIRLLLISVADPDPGSGAFLIPGSGMGKKSGSGSGMKNPEHISESFETIFWVKIPIFFLMRIRDP